MARVATGQPYRDQQRGDRQNKRNNHLKLQCPTKSAICSTTGPTSCSDGRAEWKCPLVWHWTGWRNMEDIMVGGCSLG
eukprot:12296309-Prorocentrum_lima.AAC.1